jgi:FkbM family methyltransferase
VTMTILCAGASRSGSTWQYNIVRALASETGGSVYGAWIEDYDPAHISDFHVVKIHHLARMGSLHSDFVVTCYRDLRDVMASLRRMAWYKQEGPDFVVRFLDHYVASVASWEARAVHVMRYEDMLSNPLAETSRLAAALQFPLTAIQLDSTYSRVAAMQPSRSTPTGNAADYDPETLLHAGHRASSSTPIDDASRQIIERRYANWLLSRGYTIYPSGVTNPTRKADDNKDIYPVLPEFLDDRLGTLRRTFSPDCTTSTHDDRPSDSMEVASDLGILDCLWQSAPAVVSSRIEDSVSRQAGSVHERNMTQFETHLVFEQGVGLIRPIEIETGDDKDGFIAIYDDAQDVILYFGVERTPKTLVIGGKMGNDWVNVQRIRLDEPLAQIRAKIRPLDEWRVSIDLGKGDPISYRTGIPLSTARTLSGIGQWTISEEGIAFELVSCRPPLRSLDELPILGPNPAQDLIYDFGMHNGSDTEFYLKKGFRVVAVEANPVLADASALKFRSWIEIGRLVILNIGVGPSPGTFAFYVNKTHSEWSSFDREIASRGHPVDTIEVRTVPPEQMFAVFGSPHFVKIDIEGYDHLVIDAATKLPTPPAYISFENGDIPLFEILASAGYDAFKLVNQRTVSEIPQASPAIEGLAVEYTFPFGSSGPFGEETPGRWEKPGAMRKILQRHFEQRALQTGPDVDWWDLHARRRA